MAGEKDRSGERMRLSEVVSDCVKRWFQDTLKEAKSGDIAMQVLVGQMYCNGYGIGRNTQKVEFFTGSRVWEIAEVFFMVFGVLGLWIFLWL